MRSRPGNDKSSTLHLSSPAPSEGIQETQSILQAALVYLRFGFSVIPLHGKKASIKWEEYQKCGPEESIVQQWFGESSLNVGIVTGRASGLLVLDVDGPEGNETLVSKDLLLPLTPTAKTGKGTHFYFRYPDGHEIRNFARKLPGLDLRGEGGYVVAPPSLHESGVRYSWEHPPDKIPLADAPAWLLRLANPCHALSNTRMHFLNIEGCHGLVTMFTEGRRDDDLFHVANCLVKGGMPESEALQVLEILARSCTPPFPANEVRVKVESALKRSERRAANLTQVVRDFVSVTNGHFSVTDCLESCQTVTGVTNRDTVRKILHRFYQEGLLEKYGEKDGVYRRIEQECEPIDFLHATDEQINITWPFHIERYVRILPKNVIVIAGEPNAGKTAYLLNVVRLNMHQHKIFYFSSEMGDLELRGRLSKFEGLSLQEWTFSPFERNSNFADVIRPDDLNIIDFLEMSDEFYKVGGLITEIYNKLHKGIAVIAIQKNPGTDYGLGGMRSLEKARLYLAIEHHKIKIVKAKNWAGLTNPNGLVIEFKLVQGCRFSADSDWKRE